LILVDANLLIYARVRSLPQHDAARTWLDERLSGSVKVGLPWTSLLAFLRIVTNARVFERPESLIGAWKQVQAWLDVEAAWIPAPGARHRDVLDALLRVPGVQGNLVPDAHLAAIAVEHGLTLCSTDADFARFPGLRWEDPLKP
jgi:toxin-antitoxin system PIN domain toxin